MNYNPNKAVSAKPYGIIVSYTDTLKHYTINYQESILSKQQVHGNESVHAIKYQQTKQERLLNDAMYGLRNYSSKELEEMTPDYRQSVITRFSRAKKVINRLKNEMMQLKINTFLKVIFHKSSFAQQLSEFEAQEELSIKNDMSLRELNISLDMVVDRLIETKVLPTNYRKL